MAFFPRPSSGHIIFIPLACAECDNSLPFLEASSIPLCYVLFPAPLLRPTILPSSLTLSCHLFLGLPLNLVVPKFIYNTLFRNSIFFRSLSPHLAIYFLVYLSVLSFPISYTILFWEFYFLLFSVHAHTNIINLTLLSLL